MKTAIGELAKGTSSAAELRRHLFYETSHSPALADLVGYENAKDIIDFCFIANPYYPTPEMLDDLQRNLPNLIKSYPSSNPLMSQQNLAAVLNVNPDNLMIGNGATELIAHIDTTLIDRIARADSHLRRVHRKVERPARRRTLSRSIPNSVTNCARSTTCAGSTSATCARSWSSIPGNPTGQLIPLDEMIDFMHRGPRSGARDRRRILHRLRRRGQFPASCRSPTGSRTS